MKVVKETRIGETESIVKVFNFNDKNYMKIEPSCFVTMDIKGNDGDWDKGLFITNNNIYHVTNAFGTMLDNMRTEDLYGIGSNNKLIIYVDKVKKCTVNLFNIGGQQRLLLTPTILYDEVEHTYEGCQLTINNADNYFDLTIDALESVHYILSKIDLFSYGAQLYQMYMTTIEKGEVSPVSMPTKPNRKHILLDNPVEDSVRSNLKGKIPDVPIFDMGE
jgi:hypothetical protein